jgi:hypothetical protein
MNIVIQFKQFVGLLSVLMLVCLLTACASSGSSSTSDQPAAETNSSEAQQTAQEATDVTPKSSVKNGKTLVVMPITFKSGINMHDAIRDECMLPEKLSGFIRDNALSAYETIIVDGSSAPRGADVLTVEITDLRAPKGGGWTGPKFVSVQGSLKRSGRVIGDFQGKRTSMGGAFGVFKRTCDIVGRCTKTLGADISTWLQNPGKNSTLGE